MSALDEVLTWSASLPEWQRDALRRIVTKSKVSVGDLDEVTELCKLPHGLSTATLKASPLAVEHLPSLGTVATVQLASVTNVSDVNALAKNQSLVFADGGLTVVYGDNGVGKSGYARILKRACRARGSGEPVLPNALNEAPGTPRADIMFKIDSAEASHSWKEGEASVPELAAVSVFDTTAAQVYVAQQTDVAYRPFGLDVLDTLANVCSDVRGRLEKEQVALVRQPPSWPVLPSGTEAARFLGSLTALTKDDQIERITSISNEESAELIRLEQVLADARSSDPIKRAAEIRLTVGRLRKLADVVQHAVGVLSAKAVDDAIRAREDARACAAAAEMARAAFEKGVILPGVGGAAWRALWDAARAYSVQSAYKGELFPNTAEGSRCVLCQQELSSDTKARFSTLEGFIRHETQTKAERASATLAEKRKTLVELFVVDCADLVEETATASASVGSSVGAFFVAAHKARDEVMRLLDGDGVAAHPSLDAPTSALIELCSELECRAAETEKAADPEARRATEAKVGELKARSLLAPLKQAILGEVDRLRRISAYDSCVKDASTSSITRTSTELTKKYVSDDLTKAFKQELKKVGFASPELTIVPKKGKLGALYHQIQLAHAPHASVPRVVSEGEARCLALAAFLAELQIAGHRSAIVFDDPVSSLDHGWRKRVAERLVQESLSRQVIVFTHEIVFLHQLLEAADRTDASVRCQWLSRQPGATGVVQNELPWGTLSTSKRLGVLKNELQAAEKVHRLEGHQAYDPLAIGIYAKLRQTWERAVEEVLLNDVVVRFRRGVETQRLKKLVAINPTDLDTIEAAMTKCSTWEGGHDHASVVNEPVPEPQELGADIAGLEQWAAEVRSRKPLNA